MSLALLAEQTNEEKDATSGNSSSTRAHGEFMRRPLPLTCSLLALARPLPSVSLPALDSVPLDHTEKT